MSMVRRIFMVAFIIGVVLVFAGSFSLLRSETECPSPAVFKEDLGCVLINGIEPQTTLLIITATCPSGFIQPDTRPIPILDFDDSYVACVNPSTLLELHCGDFYLPDPTMPSTFIECIIELP